jgi:hypothetical protein
VSDDLAETEVEWAVRWDNEQGGVVNYGPGDHGHTEAVKIARIYGYGTPASQVSVVSRTVTRGPWAT